MERKPTPLFFKKMPKSLTAENGAKKLLLGEFYETAIIDNPEYCECDDCDYCDAFPVGLLFKKRECMARQTKLF